MTSSTPGSPLAELARQYERVATQDFHGAAPLYERLILGLAKDAELLALIGQVPPEKRRPTLVLAAVHYLLLRRPGQPLAAFYPGVTDGAVPPGDPYPLFHTFCMAHRSELLRLLHARAVQTNEVRRCVQWLPAFTLVSRLARERPMALVEVGTSAGLNLLFDHYAYDYGAERRWGAPDSTVVLPCELRGPLVPPLPSRAPAIADRIGIDLAPIDAGDPEAALWLRACVWPEQRDRAARLRLALAVARSARLPLVAGDALDALPAAIAALPREIPICVFNSATLAYFSREGRARFSALLAALASDREIYWLSSEGPTPLHQAVVERAADWHRRDQEARAARGAGLPVPHWLVLTAFTGGGRAERALAMVDPHGAWLEWLDTAQQPA